MNQRWFRGLTISNQRAEMARPCNTSRRRRLTPTERSSWRYRQSQTDMRSPAKCQPDGKLFRCCACQANQLLSRLIDTEKLRENASNAVVTAFRSFLASRVSLVIALSELVGWHRLPVTSWWSFGVSAARESSVKMVPPSGSGGYRWSYACWLHKNIRSRSLYAYIWWYICMF